MITPFKGGGLSTVSSFVVKASRGQPGISGVAWVQHDAGKYNDSECDLPPYDNTDPDQKPEQSVCGAANFDGELLNYDSLSVWVETNGANFTGVTACVLIDGEAIDENSIPNP